MKRLTASVSAAVLAAGACAAAAVPAASAAVHQRVLPSAVGAGKSWLWLQDDPSNGSKTPGTEAVAPFADPVHWNGSLHLGVGTAPAQQSQAAHYFMQRVPLRTVESSPLAYDTYVNGSASTAKGDGPDLQLPVICQGTFSTLSFEPEHNTDSAGRQGVTPDIWQHFVSKPASAWRTSRGCRSARGSARATPRR